MSSPAVEDVPQNQPMDNAEASNPSEKPGRVVKKHARFFDSYINRILRNISNNEITSNARQQLNSVLIHFARICSNKALELTEVAKKKTISIQEIRGAAELVLSGELRELALKKGDEAVETYDADVEENAGKNAGKKTKSRQTKAGIIFPPSVIERFLRNFGYNKVMITGNSPVFLAAVMEYVTAQVLEGAGKISSSNDKVRITVRDMELAVASDPELKELFNRNHLSFLGGGVVPHIHPFLLKRVKNPESRHGNTAIKEIRRYQKTGDCLMFARHPFEMIVREICSTIRPGMKISKDVFVYLQYIIEQRLVSIMQMANNVAVYGKRLKVFPTDIEMVIAIQNNRMPKFLEYLGSDAAASSSVQINMNNVEEDEEDENEPLSDIDSEEEKDDEKDE